MIPNDALNIKKDSLLYTDYLHDSLTYCAAMHLQVQVMKLNRAEFSEAEPFHLENKHNNSKFRLFDVRDTEPKLVSLVTPEFIHYFMSKQLL